MMVFSKFVLKITFYCFFENRLNLESGLAYLKDNLHQNDERNRSTLFYTKDDISQPPILASFSIDFSKKI